MAKLRRARDQGEASRFIEMRSGKRYFVITPGYQLLALDAGTGEPRGDFGEAGIVDLTLHLDQTLDPMTAPIGSSSPPIVCKRCCDRRRCFFFQWCTRVTCGREGEGDGLTMCCNRGAPVAFQYHSRARRIRREFVGEGDAASYTGNAGGVGADERRSRAGIRFTCRF